MTNPVSKTGPVESKVKASTAGSTVGIVVSGFLLWLLDTYVWETESIPDPVIGLVGLVPVALTFLGGYLAKHTPRNDLQARGLTDPDQPPSHSRSWTDR